MCNGVQLVTAVFRMSLNPLKAAHLDGCYLSSRRNITSPRADAVEPHSSWSSLDTHSRGVCCCCNRTCAELRTPGVCRLDMARGRRGPRQIEVYCGARNVSTLEKRVS